MAAANTLHGFVENGVKLQTMLFKGMAVTCGLTGVVLCGLMATMPVKPGDEVGAKAVLVLAAIMLVAGVAFWLSASLRNKWLRELVLDNPQDVERTEILQIKANTGVAFWSVRFHGKGKQMVGFKVRDEAQAQEAVALFEQHQASTRVG